MQFMQWSKDLDTGIGIIDRQHHRIAKYLNRLEEANRHGDRQAIDLILNDLVDYTLTHFAFEESLLEKAGYPYLKAHRHVHAVFSKRIAEYRDHAMAGHDVLPELLSMLRSWLLNHSREDDADYIPYLKRLDQASLAGNGSAPLPDVSARRSVG